LRRRDLKILIERDSFRLIMSGGKMKKLNKIKSKKWIMAKEGEGEINKRKKKM